MDKTIWVLIYLMVVFQSCKKSVERLNPGVNDDFITVYNGQFFLTGAPYYFVGANYWYGPILGAPVQGDRERLIKELDLLQSYGIDNLRVLAGADGGKNPYTVSPALQYDQGQYDNDLLAGLDFFMKEAAERKMKIVLYLNNNWEWSGGMSQYLEWNGYGSVPIPNLPEYTWPDYMAYTRQFHTCEPCMEGFEDHVKFIMGRTNQYTGIKYINDPTIMSWQVANEPRVFDKEHEKDFTSWLHRTIDLMESIDSVHLISSGGEGAAGYLFNINLFERTHDHPDLDYLTMHMWPYNWDWYSEEEKNKTIDDAINKATTYVKDHVKLARKKNLPIVMSEFGFPRDKTSIAQKSTTSNRDTFYTSLFELLKESYDQNGTLAGYNFWGFGGYGESANRKDGKWEIGDDIIGDPPQEPQGFNTVFASDTSTLELIKKYNVHVNNNYDRE